MNEPQSARLANPCARRDARAAASGVALGLIAWLACGCADWPPLQPSVSGTGGEPPVIADADTAFSLTAESPGGSAGPPEVRAIRLSILQVQVPSDRRGQAERVWDHVRETVLDGETLRTLRRNGFRVGVGRAERWDAIRGTLDNITGRRVREVEPVRLPPGMPLGIELDREPHEQTIFCVERDGILSGNTWTDSRNLLRCSYTYDVRDAQRVLLSVVPEVRQRLPGFQWIRSEAGFEQAPRNDGQAFSAVAFAVPLEPGQFLLVGPSEKVEVSGVVGSAFLVEIDDSGRYDSYVFLRPEKMP